jgi:hypothetical protein
MPDYTLATAKTFCSRYSSGRFPGTSYLATIILSLWDEPHSSRHSRSLAGPTKLEEPNKIGSSAPCGVVTVHARSRNAPLEICFHSDIGDVRHRIGSGELPWKRCSIFLFGLRKFWPLGHDQLVVFPDRSPEKRLIILVRLSCRIGDLLGSYHLHWSWIL